MTYDASGNMNCRIENGVTYKQVYDVENRLSAVSVMSGGCNGAVTSTTSFIYDGDGNLVKKVNPDGSRTLYVAGLYEVDKDAGGTVAHTRTYYPAAGALRVDGTLYFMRQDHLGSTSAVMDASGNIVGRQRYYPFGETRYTSGTMYTDKLFTGQRQMVGLGIYYYNARFYSPYLNHFTQPDTIVPNLYNPQSLNRYSYVLNNPFRYNDPSGHKYCDGSGLGGECDQSGIPTSRGQLNRVLRSSGVKLKGNWKYDDAYAVYLGVTAVGEKLARTLGGSAESAFQKVFKNGVNFTWGGEGAGYGCTSVTSGGCTSGDSQINFWSMSSYSMTKNVVHELGHAFDHSLHDGPRMDLGLHHTEYLNRNLILRPNPVCDNCYDWQQHPPSMDELGKTPGETYADMFIAWTYNAWNTSTNPQNVAAVSAAQTWMNGLVP